MRNYEEEMRKKRYLVPLRRYTQLVNLYVKEKILWPTDLKRLKRLVSISYIDKTV